MLFYGDLGNKDLSEKIANVLGLEAHYPDIHVFPDGERRVKVNEDKTVGQKIVILKSLCPPVDSNILEFCFLIDAIKRSGAREIIGVISYLGYSRADHLFRTGEAVPMHVVIRAIEASGLDRAIIIDPHSAKTPELFSIPVETLSAISIFAQKIRSLDIEDEMTLVSPDMGGIRRIKMLSERLGGVGYAVVQKNRDLETGEIGADTIEGEIKDTCIIIDDIISTGKTIVQAVNLLFQKGAKDIYVFATHPVFSKDAPRLLDKSRAKKIYVTDTIFVPEEKCFKKLEILSISQLIKEALTNS